MMGPGFGSWITLNVPVLVTSAEATDEPSTSIIEYGTSTHSRLHLPSESRWSRVHSGCQTRVAFIRDWATYSVFTVIVPSRFTSPMWMIAVVSVSSTMTIALSRPFTELGHQVTLD